MARAVAFLLAMALLHLGCSRPAAPVDTRPDVVLFIIDTARADHFGAYGHSRPASPRFDALAASAVRFEHAYSHSGWTLPSIATLYTGRYPSEHGAVVDKQDYRLFGRLDKEIPTLASLYGAQGYATAAFVNNVFLAPTLGLDQGFEHYDYVDAGPMDHRTAADTVDQALKWLKASPSTRPIFLVLHIQEPHINYAPPASTRGRFTGDVVPPVELPFPDIEVLEAYKGRHTVPDAGQQQYIQQLYDEEILAADLALGAWLDGQPDRGRERWTVVTADHGEEFWDHGGFEHGHSLAGELTRIPLVVQAPGWEPSVVTTAVQHVDVFRTLAEVAGGPVPVGTHGAPLLGVIQGEVPARPILQEDCLFDVPRAAVLHEGYRFDMELRTSDVALWKLDEHGQHGVLVEDPAVREAEGFPLFQLLGELRGGYELHQAAADRLTVSGLMLEHLQALGYVDP